MLEKTPDLRRMLIGVQVRLDQVTRSREAPNSYTPRAIEHSQADVPMLKSVLEGIHEQHHSILLMFFDDDGQVFESTRVCEECYRFAESLNVLVDESTPEEVKYPCATIRAMDEKAREAHHEDPVRD